MNQIITKIEHPFPYLKIENMYTEDELELIAEELAFLTHKEKLEEPEITGSAVTENGKILKDNKGIFLDDLYKKRQISNILTINRKIFNREYLESYASLNFGYGSILECDQDTTLISYYENGGYYYPHKDQAVHTALTWFFKTPKLFDGGNLIFPKYEQEIEIQHNMTIIFPSFVLHSVEEVTMDEDLSPGLGRYCMSQFISIKT
jgi:Rps23 Pro-64 3,4-dihydroxylase Tpa1-like proline 4-hydroxylase